MGPRMRRASCRSFGTAQQQSQRLKPLRTPRYWIPFRQFDTVLSGKSVCVNTQGNWFNTAALASISNSDCNEHRGKWSTSAHCKRSSGIEIYTGGDLLGLH